MDHPPTNGRKLMVDDTRVLSPRTRDEGWEIVRRGEDLPCWISLHGWPDAIALDYDLDVAGGLWDGAQTAQWLVNAFRHTGRDPSAFPWWDVHSRRGEHNVEMERILAPFAARRVPWLAPIGKAKP